MTEHARKNQIVIIGVLITMVLVVLLFVGRNREDGNNIYIPTATTQSDAWILVEYPDGVSFSYPGEWDAVIYDPFDNKPSAHFSSSGQINAVVLSSSIGPEELAKPDVESGNYTFKLIHGSEDDFNGLEYYGELDQKLFYEMEDESDTAEREDAVDGMRYVVGRIIKYREGSVRIECRILESQYFSQISVCERMVKSLNIDDEN